MSVSFRCENDFYCQPQYSLQPGDSSRLLITQGGNHYLVDLPRFDGPDPGSGPPPAAVTADVARFSMDDLVSGAWYDGRMFKVRQDEDAWPRDSTIGLFFCEPGAAEWRQSVVLARQREIPHQDLSLLDIDVRGALVYDGEAFKSYRFVRESEARQALNDE